MKNSNRFSSRSRDGVVLVVDDLEKNLQLLGELLSDQHYEVMLASSGASALERVQARKPDLILLDIMMPEMDGIETCRRLQQDPATQDIPIIFLTATNDSEMAVRGLSEGAVDYITKPFSASELLARVDTHVALKQSRDETRRVIEEKNDLLATVAHDLKNPLTSIRVAALTLKRELAGTGPQELAEIIAESSDELLSLIEDRLAHSARGATPLQLNITTVSLAEILQMVV